MTKSTSKKLEALIDSCLASTPYEVVLLEYQKSGREWVLRVFIDKEDAGIRSQITFEDCETVSHMLSEMLDREDPINQNYHLEVSSPGVDRPLVKQADFKKFIQQRVYLKLHKPIDGLKTFTGQLSAFENEVVKIHNEQDDRAYEIPFNNIAKATLKPLLNFS